MRLQEGKEAEASVRPQAALRRTNALQFEEHDLKSSITGINFNNTPLRKDQSTLHYLKTLYGCLPSLDRPGHTNHRILNASAPPRLSTPHLS